ncbi:MAG: hypothetical protein GXP10_07365 [Gammaproteobacteria bacterium]|nr:hypothetical protein [Gammaproteobacteria bacterium]
MPVRWRHQRGLSLVEILVAVTLSLVLLGGLVQMFAGSKDAYRLQGNMNVLQDNGRFATNMIKYSIRMADHWGNAESIVPATTSAAPVVIGSGNCSSAWSLDINEALHGYEGGATPPAAVDCIAAGDYVTGSDMVVLRYAGSTAVSTDVVDNSDTIYVRGRVGSSGVLFKGSEVASIDSGLQLYEAANPDPVDVSNYPYRVELYFIRPCSVKLGTVCSSSDDSGQPIPTLTRYTLLPSVGGGADQLVQQALVEGVEQLQLQYGIDTDGDGFTNVYETAASLDVNGSYNWDSVVSVRMGLLVRTIEQDGAYTSPASYSLLAANDYTVPAAQRSYHRQLFTQIVQVRNRSRN